MTRTSWSLVLAFTLGCDAEKGWFEAGSYVLESIEGRELAPDSRIEIGFSGGREMYASAGCAGLETRYWLANGELVLDGGPIGSDLGVGCEASQHEEEEWLEGFLREGVAYELDAPRLTLVGDDVTIVLLDEEIANPDRPLVGTVWEINGLVSSGVVMGVGGSVLIFGADGRLAIDGPCAAGAADYVADEHFVTLENVAIDPQQCPGDELGQAFDEHLREFLVDGPFVWEIDDTRLVLGDSDLGLMLRSE